MLPTTEILTWELERLTGRRTLLMNPPDAETLAIFDEDPSTVAHFTNYAGYLALKDLGVASTFGVEVTGEFDAAVLYLPKGREHLEMLASLAMARLTPGGILLVVGHNKAGGKSAVKHLGRLFGDAEKLVSARHCSLAMAPRPDTVARPTADDWATRFESEGSWVSFPGVFAHGRRDDGTALLLAHRPKRIAGPVLDVGCGAGLIGIGLAEADDALEVEMVDVNAFAIEAARRNVTARGLDDRVRVYPSDVYSDTASSYSTIVSNPPFHEGIATERQVASRLIEQSAARLLSKGILLLVANRFLAYQPLMDAAFGRHDVRYNGKRYRVYEATQSRKNRRAARASQREAT